MGYALRWVGEIMSIHVREQQIKVTLPAAAVRMLIVQPYLELQSPPQEPFPLRPGCRQHLLDAITNVFDVSRTYAPHFVLFPEFALPGVEGVERVAACLAADAVPSPMIAIGGLEGLSKAEYVRLCELNGIHVDPENTPDRVGEAEWVNTSVTFVKGDDRDVSMWIQPKLSPSWPEASANHQNMFKGGVVRIFRTQFDNHVPCRFFPLLCFDWVGIRDGMAIPDAILQEFNQTCQDAGSPQDLHWVFVLQYNPSPNHATFLTAAKNFLTQPTPPFVRRQDAAVVMVCTAGSSKPARGMPFGYSSLIFSPRAPFDEKTCRPTFATESTRLRRSNVLSTCKDALFREMGECLHGAEVRVPTFVVADPTDRTPAFAQAEVSPLIGATTDPRIPGSAVPAVVKWTNDELDRLPDLCATYFTGSTLEGRIRSAQSQAVKSYRWLRSQDLAVRIDGACAPRATRKNVDIDPAADVDTAWDSDESNSLHHVIQTLTLLGGGVDLDSVGSELHARHASRGVEIAAIWGPTHALCVGALKRLAARTHSPIVVVSRDANNVPHLPRETESFADPRGGDGVKFTDSQTLISKALTLLEADYQGYISELLNVPDRRII